MDKSLLIQAFTKFFLGIIILGALLFLPAWSLHYWQGWLLMGILFVPMFLASPISFLIMLGYIPVIVKRIKNEEAVLEEGLEGYKDYKKRVKYRMIPFIW